MVFESKSTEEKRQNKCQNVDEFDFLNHGFEWEI